MKTQLSTENPRDQSILKVELQRRVQMLTMNSKAVDSKGIACIRGMTRIERRSPFSISRISVVGGRFSNLEIIFR